MTALRIDVAPAFRPLLAPARYKGAWGGRGSGKSHFFATQLIADHLRQPGLRSVCIRENQKSLKESSKRLLEDKLKAMGLGLAHGFEVQHDVIKCPGDGLIVFQGMKDHTAESIKSLEGYGRAWIAEAQTFTENSLKLLRPTIRAPGSELWFDWNPKRKTDPVDAMFRAETLPTGSIVVKANWSDNPWFPVELDQERRDCARDAPEEYGHIWEGGYATVAKGAYFAKDIVKARMEGRIGNVARDPLMPVYAFWDIGISDATSIWIAQWIGREIRVLDYYEAVGQPLAAHLEWLRSNHYGKAICYLPHDANQADKVTATKFEDHIRSAEFEVRTIPNQGKGAARKRVEAARRIFPRIWFNEKLVLPGLEALGWYHERKDEARNIGLGPEHDWSSHGADSFGLMCVAYEEPTRPGAPAKPRKMDWVL